MRVLHFQSQQASDPNYPKHLAATLHRGVRGWGGSTHEMMCVVEAGTEVR